MIETWLSPRSPTCFAPSALARSGTRSTRSSRPWGRNGEVSAASADKSAGAFALMRKGLTGVAGAAVAFGGAFAGFEAIKTGLNTQQSQDQLKAVTEQAHLSAQAFGHLDAAAVKTSQSGGFGANTERDALIQLVGASKSATTAIKGNSAAIALARGTSLSYSSAVLDGEQRARRSL